VRVRSTTKRTKFGKNVSRGPRNSPETRGIPASSRAKRRKFDQSVFKTNNDVCTYYYQRFDNKFCSAHGVHFRRFFFATTRPRVPGALKMLRIARKPATGKSIKQTLWRKRERKKNAYALYMYVLHWNGFPWNRKGCQYCNNNDNCSTILLISRHVRNDGGDEKNNETTW